MSTNLTAVLQQLLQNTSNLKVLQRLMTPDATYVSLNFDNPELKKVEPWTGTHKGPQALSEVFAAIQRFWETLDLKVTDTIEQGSRVALFGSFTYKSNVTGKEITSPFGLLARFEGEGWPTSSFSRTAMALQARSKPGAPHGSTAILREKRSRSNAWRSLTKGCADRDRGGPAVAFDIRKRAADPARAVPTVNGTAGIMQAVD
jgi:hypothetical protein